MPAIWVCQREAKSASFKWKGENSRLNKERGNKCRLRLLRCTGRTNLLSMNLQRREKKFALVCWETGRDLIHTAFVTLLTRHLVASVSHTNVNTMPVFWLLVVCAHLPAFGIPGAILLPIFVVIDPWVFGFATWLLCVFYGDSEIEKCCHLHCLPQILFLLNFI